MEAEWRRRGGGVEAAVSWVEVAAEAGSRLTCVVGAEAPLRREEEEADALAHPVEQPRQGQTLRGATVRRVRRVRELYSTTLLLLYYNHYY